MKIKHLEVSNWRSIKNINIQAQDLMVVIGQNNHGKSNLLSALLYFFGEIKHQDLDFNYGSSQLYVEITFSDLDESDLITFKKYLTNENHIVVRKTAHLGGSFEYKGYIENPSEDWLQEANAGAYIKRELAESLPFHPYIPDSGRISKQHVIDAQNTYIEHNRDSLEFSFQQEETNFLGSKNVASGIFGKVYFIPAVKEASDDFTSKDTSVFGKLYSDVIAAMSEQNAEWKETRENLTRLFGTLNKLDVDGSSNEGRPAQLNEFESELSEELKAWGAKIEVEILPPDIESVFRANTQVWVDDGVRTDIKRKGHGLQRALTVALIQVVANRSRMNADSSSEETTTRKASNSSYFIFEEPELYLHPQAQKSLFESFVDLSENGNQVFICTHSSGLIDVEKYKSIYIMFKDNEPDGSKIKQCSEDLFEGDAKKDFNISYWINPDRGELFFATKVILVEGATDKTALPLTAKLLGIFRHDYTFVDCASKDSIPLYIRLLNKFSIPYTVVYDLDHQSHKGTDAIGAADASSERIENEIDASLGNSIIFNNDIEEEIGLVDGGRNKPFLAVSHISSDDWEMPNEFKDKVCQIYDVAL